MKIVDIIFTTDNPDNPEQTPNSVFSSPLLGRGKDVDQKEAAEEIQGHICGWCLDSKTASLWYCSDLKQSKWQKQLICRV